MMIFFENYSLRYAHNSSNSYVLLAHFHMHRFLFYAKNYLKFLFVLLLLL